MIKGERKKLKGDPCIYKNNFLFILFKVKLKSASMECSWKTGSLFIDNFYQYLKGIEWSASMEQRRVKGCGDWYDKMATGPHG